MRRPDRQHDPLRRLNRERLRDLCRRWHVKELALFGSILRSDFRQHSDVDLLVQFLPTAQWSLLDIMAMKEELKELFGGREVDLVEADAIRNPLRRRAILNSKQVIYEAAS